MATPYTRTPARRSGLSRAVSGRFSCLYLLALALPLAVLVDVAPGSAVASSAAQGSNSVQQSVTIAVLPPISQPGKTTASSAGARTVVTAAFRPKVAGRPVVLERRRDGLWKGVDQARLDRNGQVTFAAPTRLGGRAATYRVCATPYDGLPGLRSGPARATVWGQPGVRRRVRRQVPRPGVAAPRPGLQPVGRPQGLEGRPRRSRGCRRRPAAQRACGPRAGERGLHDPGLRGQPHRQLRLQTQRTRVHGELLRLPVRRRRSPDAVPPPPRPTRVVLDAAARLRRTRADTRGARRSM